MTTGPPVGGRCDGCGRPSRILRGVDQDPATLCHTWLCVTCVAITKEKAHAVVTP